MSFFSPTGFDNDLKIYLALACVFLKVPHKAVFMTSRRSEKTSYLHKLCHTISQNTLQPSKDVSLRGNGG
jgi:hypothetical protein